MSMKRNAVLAAVAMAAACSASVQAAPFTLTFEGVGNNAQILDFYNGGTDSQGNSGVNYGVRFGGNALGLVDGDAGGNGNFANEPTPSTTMYFLSGTAILNYAPGFRDGFSFFYTSTNFEGVVRVYAGENAAGTLLGELVLGINSSPGTCSGDPGGDFCNWTAAGLDFAGVAKSIDFGGTVDQIGYDNITFGSSDPTVKPVSEPAGFGLLALAGIGAVASRRRPSKGART
jgi:MYXO-CTERM domain-containing protein